MKITYEVESWKRGTYSEGNTKTKVFEEKPLAVHYARYIEAVRDRVAIIVQVTKENIEDRDWDKS